MNCCRAERPSDLPPGPCPRSGSAGKAVARETVLALLAPEAVERLAGGPYRFCPDADCDVVYFGSDGSAFVTSDLAVAVWQKLPFGSRPVCYCFEESETSIRAEIEACGRSAAVERVRAHTAAGRCACEVRNPRGVCCLGDLAAAVRRVEEAVAAQGAT